MKRILVLGVYGMAGHMITMYLNSLNTYEVFNTSNKKIFDENTFILDVFDIKKINELINHLNPDIIINCIGILNDKSDIDVKNTAFINGFLPHYLEVTNCYK